jgi:SNF2 family DNA or RNA helicase
MYHQEVHSPFRGGILADEMGMGASNALIVSVYFDWDQKRLPCVLLMLT